MMVRTACLLAVVLAAFAPPASAASPVFQELPKATIVVTADARGLEGLALVRQTDESEGQPVQFTSSAGPSPGQRATTWACTPGEYIVRTATLVSLPLGLDAAGCGETHSVALVPAATVAGTARVATGVDTPRTLALELRACSDDGHGKVLGAYRARLESDGAFTAAIPAACTDLLIRAADLAPVPFPRFALSPGARRALGAVTLAPGATVSVLVRSASDEAVPRAAVSVVPAEDYVSFVDVLLTGKPVHAASEAEATPDGVAHVIGISSPLVYVVARSGNRIGFAGPVELHPGERQVLEPIVVASGGTVGVAVTGDRTWITPGARLFVLGTPLVAGRSLRATHLEFDLPEDENEAQPAPVAGRWHFELRLDSATILDQRDVDVFAEAHTQVALSISDRLFRGRVLVGDAAMAGLLSLRRRPRMAGQELTTSVDDDGHFAAPLPEPGTYSARFSNADGTIRAAPATAEFVEGRETTVRIALTRLTGVVLLASGAPAGGASVSVRYPSARLADDPMLGTELLPLGRADANGAFAIPYLEPGQWEVQARREPLASPPQLVTLGETSSPPLRLVLDRDPWLTVRVVNVRGEPVAGARGMAVAPSPQPGGAPASPSLSSGDDGRCRVALDRPPGSAVSFEVTAAGYPVAAFRVVPEDQEVVLTMPPGGGQVRIIAPRADGAASSQPADVGTYMLVNSQGGLVPLGSLTALNAATLVAAPGSLTVVIPSLAAGEWQLAKFADARSGVLYLSGNWPLPVVREFTVVPGGSTIVDLRQP